MAAAKTDLPSRVAKRLTIAPRASNESHESDQKHQYKQRGH
jgi:hypothetical protein